MFPSVARGSVFPLLYAVAGLVMMVTAGGGCVDVAVRSAQNAANLKSLSNTFVRLMGLRFRVRHVRNLHSLKGPFEHNDCKFLRCFLYLIG